MTIDDRLREIDRQIDALKGERTKLEKQGFDEFGKSMTHNIGRCFKAGRDKYAIITDVPHYYNKHWFPAFIIDNGIDDDIVKFYQDEVFSKDGVEFADNDWCEAIPWREINQEEFRRALASAISDLYISVFHVEKEAQQ